MDSEFSRLLKKTGAYGLVNSVSHPIVFIEGLPQATPHELVLFDSGQKGEVFTINRGIVEARLFSHEPVRVGTKATRTGQMLSVPVGDEILGKTVSPVGEPLDNTIRYEIPKETRQLDSGKPIGISGRKKISRHLTTGVSLVDLMIPLGMGQRELVVGERKTGKTSLLLTAIKTQAAHGVVSIYAAIAKKKSEIKRLQEFFVKEKIMDKVIIVATTAYDSPTLIYQTPYGAMTIAEYFRDRGINTLVILDDLSTHAKFYRELSLLARRFPGRESYPGDIFYAHSKLLERGGNYYHSEVGEVSITCLPVIEIVEGDLASYISTNAMGITDGHIYVDSNIYYQGRRPAVNIPLSVTRVGRQTLDKLSREINKNMVAFVNSYDRLLNLSHFGQELTPEVKKNLQIGDIIYKFFNQPYQLVIPKSIQLILIAMILNGIIDSKDQLTKTQSTLLNAYQSQQNKEWLDGLSASANIKEFYSKINDQKDKLLSLAS